MCSELFRIPIEWQGLPIFGVGVLLVLWLIGGGLAMLYVSRQAGRSAEAWGYLPGLLIGAVGIVMVGRMFPEGLPIRGFGVMVLIGSVSAIWLLIYRAQKVGISADTIISLATGLFIGGFLGARLFYVIEYWDTRFKSDSWVTTLVEIFKFTEGGLVFYGSMIGGGIAYVVLTRRMKLPALALGDLIAPSLLIGLAFGRLGCLLNGCCYGGETDKRWAVTFPRESVLYMEQASAGRMYAVRIGPRDKDDPRPMIAAVDERSAAAQAGLEPGTQLAKIDGRPVEHFETARQEVLLAFHSGRPLRLETADGQSYEIPFSDSPRSRPVHPTQVYSSVNAFLLAGVLWAFYPLRRRDGEVIALLILLYPLARFLLEVIRIDESAVFGTGLSISQNISVVLFVSALIFWGYLWNQPQKKATFSLGNSA